MNTDARQNKDQKSYIRFGDTEIIDDLSKRSLDKVVYVVGIKAKFV